MKKFLVIYLIFSFCASALPDSYTISLFQFGNLLSHFHDHNTADHHMTGISFLISHYFENHHHEHDHDKHHELPFNDQHNGIINASAQLPFILPHHFPPVADSTCTNRDLAIIVKSQPFHSGSYLDDIWQPPRA